MSTAHIFYIPIMIITGVLAGFFIGRSYSESEQRKAASERRRREALKMRGGSGIDKSGKNQEGKEEK